MVVLEGKEWDADLYRMRREVGHGASSSVMLAPSVSSSNSQSTTCSEALRLSAPCLGLTDLSGFLSWYHQLYQIASLRIHLCTISQVAFDINGSGSICWASHDSNLPPLCLQSLSLFKEQSFLGEELNINRGLKGYLQVNHMCLNRVLDLGSCADV